jgi:predicted  nucleic acid-binding Zn-ribbon protein
MVFEKQPTELTALSSELVRRLNENSRRIRLLEEKISKTEAAMDSLQQTAINQMNDLKINLDRIVAKMNGISEKLNEMQNETMRLNKEVGRAATKAEVKQLETFIDLVNPITSKFVTKDELERALQERLMRKA